MRKITDHVYQITLGAVNAFVIEDDGLTLVDTGYKGSADKIFNAIKKGGKDPKDIRRIILTHLHLDHAGSAAEIKEGSMYRSWPMKRMRRRSKKESQDENPELFRREGSTGLCFSF